MKTFGKIAYNLQICKLETVAHFIYLLENSDFF